MRFFLLRCVRNDFVALIFFFAVTRILKSEQVQQVSISCSGRHFVQNDEVEDVKILRILNFIRKKYNEMREEKNNNKSLWVTGKLFVEISYFMSRKKK